MQHSHLFKLVAYGFFGDFFFFFFVWWKLLLTRKRPWNWSITAGKWQKKDFVTTEGKENSSFLKTSSNSFELSKTIFKSYSGAEKKCLSFYPQSSDAHNLKYFSTSLGSLQGRWKQTQCIHPAPWAVSAHWRCIICSGQIHSCTVREPVLTFGSKNDLKLGKNIVFHYANSNFPGPL